MSGKDSNYEGINKLRVAANAPFSGLAAGIGQATPAPPHTNSLAYVEICLGEITERITRMRTTSVILADALSGPAPDDGGGAACETAPSGFVERVLDKLACMDRLLSYISNDHDRMIRAIFGESATHTRNAL